MQIAIGLGIGIALMALLLLVVVKAKNTLVKKQEEEIKQLNQSLMQLREEKTKVEVNSATILAESKSKIDIYEDKVKELQQLKEQLQSILEERENLIKANSSLKADYDVREEVYTANLEEKKQLKQILDKTITEREALIKSNSALRTEIDAKNEVYTSTTKELTEIKKLLEISNLERENLIKANSSLKAENEATCQMLDHKEEEISKRLKQQEEQFFQQTETLKLQFKELSEQLLKNKVEELGNSNKTNLTPVIDALKEEMKRVGDEIKDSREKSIEQKSSLDTAIRDMMARTNEIGTEATKLAEALKGKSKTQGIYGELILADILTRSGLKEGEQFECQVMLRDEQGNAIVNEETRSKMIPDVVVHYPDKDLIIDSKVSLTAYLEWCNAETDEDRTVAAKRHIISIRNHIKEIVTKSYAAYRKDVKRETIDCVVMFIPNEGALQLMRDIEPSLWYEAYDQKVIITSELSLFSLLKMIENYWAQVIQQRNQDKIIKAAENMLERLASLYEMVDDVEKAFKNVENKFENVKSKMLTGRQSIATSARQVIESGVKSSKIEKRFSDDDTLIIENENN